MRDAPVNDKLRIKLGFAATSGTGSDHPLSTAPGRVVTSSQLVYPTVHQAAYTHNDSSTGMVP